MSYWGILCLLLTILIQGIIASSVKARRQNAIPGKIDESLGHQDFVFRAHRTYLNSLENFPAIFGAIVLAILVGVGALWLSVLVWGYALARIIHMILYYAIATEKNPSPRSYFYLISLLCNIGIFVLCAVRLYQA